MGRRILIASGKGGVGKTTISAGLGESLAKLGASVCVIDLDFSFNNLDIVASIENKVVYDLGDYLQGKCRLKQTLIEFKRGLNLYFISSAKVDTDNIDIAKIEEAILKLSQIFDYIILDSPAGTSIGYKIGEKVATETLLVVCPQISSVRDACILKNSICFKKNMVIKIIINKIRGDLVACDKMLNASQIEKLLDLNCIGIIPENDEFIINSNIKSVLGSSGEIEEALSIIAENLHYNKNSKLDYLHKYKGILGRIRAKLKKGA